MRRIIRVETKSYVTAKAMAPWAKAWIKSEDGFIGFEDTCDYYRNLPQEDSRS